MRRTAIGCAVALAMFLASLTAAPGAAPTGPPLSVTESTVRDTLHCDGGLARSPIEPVLFVHGTGGDSEADFSWNWNRAFQQRAWAYCNLDLPQLGNGDIQKAAEYVVRAIRIMHTSSGRKIGIVGHSQGGMIGRWALKYWPGTRGMVADYVGLASSNHGTTVFNLGCAPAPRPTGSSVRSRVSSRRSTEVPRPGPASATPRSPP